LNSIAAAAAAAATVAVVVVVVVFFFFPWRYTTHSGCVFYSPLSDFSLLTYEVT